MAPHCRKCKRNLREGNICPECKKKDIDEKIKKSIDRRIAKQHNTIQYGISQVKEQAEQLFWATSHINCFRSSFGKSESDKHRQKKFERWIHHRKHGRSVFTELIFKKGMGRADLVIVDKGFIFVEEIVCSEKEASLVAKKDKYPFPIQIIRT